MYKVNWSRMHMRFCKTLKTSSEILKRPIRFCESGQTSSRIKWTFLDNMKSVATLVNSCRNPRISKRNLKWQDTKSKKRSAADHQWFQIHRCGWKSQDQQADFKQISFVATLKSLVQSVDDLDFFCNKHII